MSKFGKQVELKEELREKERVRKRKLSDFLFSLSNTILGSLVIGEALLILEGGKDYNEWVIIITLAIGMTIFVALVRMGYKFLK